MDNRLEQDSLIEDALQNYPLAPMPRDITASVMTRIQTTSAPRPFQVTWNDFAIALPIKPPFFPLLPYKNVFKNNFPALRISKSSLKTDF